MSDDGAGAPVAERPRWRRRLRTTLLAAVVVVVVLGLVLGTRAVLVKLSVHRYAAYWNERARQPGDLLYVALGDSTAQGVGASKARKGYVGLLADQLAEQRHASVRVVNLSVSGARAADVVRVQLPRLKSVLATNPAPALVTITIGANDAGRTDEDAFRASIRTVDAALPAGAEVADVPDFGGGGRAASAVRLGEIIREENVRRRTVVTVHLYDATRHFTWSDYAGDFFHPSDRGYRRYYGAFLAAEPDLGHR